MAEFNEKQQNFLNDLKEEFKTLTRRQLEERACLAWRDIMKGMIEKINIQNSFEKVSDLYLETRQFLNSLGYFRGQFGDKDMNSLKLFSVWVK